MNKGLLLANVGVIVVSVLIALTVEFEVDYFPRNFPATLVSNFFIQASHQHHLQDDVADFAVTATRRLEESTAEVPKGHYHDKLYSHNFSDYSVHKKAWMVLENVNGLANEEVVVVVTSTAAREGVYLRSRIIESGRTWMRLFANVIVVIEDTFDARYAMRHCHVTDYEKYTSFACHNEPTYLLSRECTSDYYGGNGPCCKVDDAINFVTNVRADFFEGIKFMLHGDDDDFWRADQVLRWLATIDKSGFNHLPIIANPSMFEPNHNGVWHVKNCHEIVTAGGWYQPMMLNHAALERMKVMSAAYGIKDTCNGFDVTHDVGMEVVAWLMGLYKVHIPRVQVNSNHKGLGIFQPGDMIAHAVRHDPKVDHCDGQGWPSEEKHNQAVVVGCGDIGHPSYHHDGRKNWADMYDAWNYYKENGVDIILDKAGVNEYKETYVVLPAPDIAAGSPVQLKHILKEKPPNMANIEGEKLVTITGEEVTLLKGETIEMRTIPNIQYLFGYKDTAHGQKYDIIKEWHQFTMKDCSPPGNV